VRICGRHRFSFVGDLSVKRLRAVVPRAVRNRIEAGGADCPSVSSGRILSGESGIGGFFGGSATLCGRRRSRTDLPCFFAILLASFFAGFSGGTTGVASGISSANVPRPLGSLSDSTHRKMVSLSSSMAAHPARPKLAGTDTEMSATRTQARMDNLAVGLVAAGSPLRLPFEGKARMAPYGCSAVNWPEMSSTRAGRPRQSRERQINARRERRHKWPRW
jgi:hypothetical protein